MIRALVRRLHILAVVAFFAAVGCAAPEAGDDTETMPPPGTSAVPTAPREPSAAPAVTQGTFVGAVDGTDVVIGLVSDGKSVAAFATDGDSVFTWTRPTSVDGNLSELEDRDTGDFLGGIEFFEGGVRGELFIDHTPFSFEAAPATGHAGIRRTVSGDAETGWLLGNDGTVRGLTQRGGKLAKAGALEGEPLTDPNAEAFKPR